MVMPSPADWSSHHAQDPVYQQVQYETKIQQHRALRVLAFPARRWLDMLAIPVCLNIMLYLLWPWISRWWATWIQGALIHIMADLEFRTYAMWFNSMQPLRTPYIASFIPSVFQWWLGMAACGICIALIALIPQRSRPIKYMLGFVSLLQGSAQLFFLINPGGFPYSASTYLASQLETSVGLMFLVPWIMTFIFNIFPFHSLKKIALSSLVLFYLMLLAPLQVAVHAYVLTVGSMLWMPMLYFMGGISLSIFTIICLYAWAMTWESLETGENDNYHSDANPHAVT